MKKAGLYSILLIMFQLIAVQAAFSQEEDTTKKRKSPKAITTQEIGQTMVSIEYSQPSVKDRKIWGGLVPYNKIWRTGANEATVLTLSKDILIEGHEVPKGKYALFTIPGKEKWTIILNTDHDQWGAYKYEQNKDFLRFEVEPEQIESHTEKLTFYIEPTGVVNLEWEKLRVPFTIEEQMAGP